MISDKAKRLSGVAAVFTYADVPQNKYATAGHPYSLDPSHKDVEDRLLLTRQDVGYWGDEIAIVVAENNLVLQSALKADRCGPMKENQPLLNSGSILWPGVPGRSMPGRRTSLANPVILSVRKIEDALAQSQTSCWTSRISTPRCTQHCHIENHIAYAYMEDFEHIVVVSSTQIPHIARRIVGEALGLPWGRIRVVKPYIGGGFGAKQDVILEPMVAFLTLKLGGRPIK